jgi:hypothetical protein
MPSQACSTPAVSHSHGKGSRRWPMLSSIVGAARPWNALTTAAGRVHYCWGRDASLLPDDAMGCVKRPTLRVNSLLCSQSTAVYSRQYSPALHWLGSAGAASPVRMIGCACQRKPPLVSRLSSLVSRLSSLACLPACLPACLQLRDRPSESRAEQLATVQSTPSGLQAGKRRGCCTHTPARPRF